VEDMTKELHSRYPEYGRRKLDVFKKKVNETFDKVIVSPLIRRSSACSCQN